VDGGLTVDGSFSAHFEHCVAVTKDGPVDFDEVKAPRYWLRASSQKARSGFFKESMSKEDAIEVMAVVSGTAAERYVQGGTREQAPGTGACLRQDAQKNFIRILPGDKSRGGAFALRLESRKNRFIAISKIGP